MDEDDVLSSSSDEQGLGDKVKAEIQEIFRNPKLDLNSITIKNILEQLQVKLKVSADELNEIKPDIKEWVRDEVLHFNGVEDDGEEDTDELTDGPPPGEELRTEASNRRKRPSKPKVVGESESEEDASEDEEPSSPQKTAKKRAKNRRTEQSGNKKRQRKSTEKEEENQFLSRLRQLARAVGVGPRVYQEMKAITDDEEKADFLAEKLRTAGFTWKGRVPSKADIKRAQEKHEKQKDLEGIDTSLIIEGGRRRGAAARQHMPVEDQKENERNKKSTSARVVDSDEGEFTF